MVEVRALKRECGGIPLVVILSNILMGGETQMVMVVVRGDSVVMS